MHGIPAELVDQATYAQQLVLLEIVKDDIKEQINIQANAVNIGVYGNDKS